MRSLLALWRPSTCQAKHVEWNDRGYESCSARRASVHHCRNAYPVARGEAEEAHCHSGKSSLQRFQRVLKIRFADSTYSKVMLFSFVAPHEGRILLANFDGKDLVIRKSPLYSFGPECQEYQESMSLFTRYQASSISPEGSTKILSS
jgi:hypothetical protein